METTQASLDHLTWENPMGERCKDALRLDFNRKLKVEFHGTKVTNDVVKFYNKRGTAEQWIKEGKYALNWTRLSCHGFVDNQVRLQLFALAYNL